MVFCSFFFVNEQENTSFLFTRPLCLASHEHDFVIKESGNIMHVSKVMYIYTQRGIVVELPKNPKTLQAREIDRKKLKARERCIIFIFA